MKLIHLFILSASIFLAGCGGGSSNSDVGDKSPSSSDTEAPIIINLDSIKSEIDKHDVITLIFSEEIDTSSASVSLLNYDTDDYVITWNAEQTQVTISPNSEWAYGLLELNLAVQDLIGNSLVSQTITINVPDINPPIILSSYATNYIFTAQEAMVFEFSESLDISKLIITSETIAVENINIEWSADNTKVTLTPEFNWPGGNSRLSLSYGDIAGNIVAGVFVMDIKAALTFSNMQPANVVIDYLLNDDSSINIRSPYGNQYIDNDALWVADYAADKIYKINNTEVESDTPNAGTISSVEYMDESNEIISRSLDGPQAPFIHNGKLIVTEYENNTVVIYNEIPQEGQANLGITLGAMDDGNCSQTGMSSPEMATVGGNKLLVADASNHRILIWNDVPSSAADTPDLILGQNSFDTCAANDESQVGIPPDLPSARTLSYPRGVWSDGNKLIAIDGNNRILIWNNFPTENFVEADIVLGQPDFLSNENNNDTDEEGNAIASARTIYGAYEGIHSNGQQIFVADSDNNRVLIWNSWPAENYQAADMVLGQSNFSNTAVNDSDQDGVSDTMTDATFSYPAGVFIQGSTLVVSDEENARIMLFESL
jgi:hypothetical protein